MQVVGGQKQLEVKAQEAQGDGGGEPGAAVTWRPRGDGVRKSNDRLCHCRSVIRDVAWVTGFNTGLTECDKDGGESPTAVGLGESTREGVRESKNRHPFRCTGT